MALVQSTVVADYEIEHVVAITLGQWMVVKIAYQQETSCTLNMISATLIPVVCIIWKISLRVFRYSKCFHWSKKLKIVILNIKQFIANGMLGSGALALKRVEREPKMAPAPNWSLSLMEERALVQILALTHVTKTIVQVFQISKKYDKQIQDNIICMHKVCIQ